MSVSACLPTLISNTNTLGLGLPVNRFAIGLLSRSRSVCCLFVSYICCLSVCKYLPACLVYLPACLLPVGISGCLSVFLPTRIYNTMGLGLAINRLAILELDLGLSTVYLSRMYVVCLSVCLSVSLPACLP